MKKIFLFVALAAVFLSTLAYAKPSFQYAPPQIRLPLMQTAPKIDGVIDSKEWQGADRMERFGKSAPLSTQQASFWVGADAQNVYIAVRTETPPNNQILNRANPLPGDEDARPFADDSLEVYLCPNPDAPKSGQRVYQGIFNAKGAIYDQLYTSNGGKMWRGKWQIKSTVQHNFWSCEIALPWKSIDINSSPQDKTVAIRIGRNWRRSVAPKQTEWSPMGGAYVAVSTMARVTWDSKAPVVQTLQLQDAPDQPGNIAVQISNPTASPVKVLSRIDWEPQSSYDAHLKKVLSIPAGKSEKVSLHGPAEVNEPIATNIEVTSPDGKTIYYSRNFSWTINRPMQLWQLNGDAAKRIDTQFAYFPSFNAMHVRVDLASLQQRQSVRGVELILRQKGSSQNIAQVTMPPLKDNSTELRRWDIPDLKAGEYELITQLQGVTVKPQIQTFERQHFPWEGNKLGTSDIVVPPFTPIKVSGNEIDTVLRQHQMNGIGLWNQVTADGKKLLQAPMYLQATIGGKVLLAKGAIKVLSHKDTKATTQANWEAGALQGSTKSVWDYDGVMKSTFTLQPTNKTIDQLSIIIPLNNTLMPLMHECTDGIRINYAGIVPAGTGVVWKSSEAAHNSIIGSYVPYIWVGGPERGLAVFGTNDAGWIVDGKTPDQEIIRQKDGTLVLRLNLIQKPSTWNKPRQITIAFQATPVKPMPQNWRLWTVYAHGKAKAPGQYNQGWIGSCYGWGSVTAYYDIYPRNQDFSIFDAFAKARKTGKVDQAFIDNWMKGYRLPNGASGDAMRKKYLAEVTHGFRVNAGQPDGMLIYTNSHAARFSQPAGKTYLNEWNSNAFPQREWSFLESSNAVDPVKSYRDFSAWYWKKMLTTFDDGIYWDNIFFISNFNPITSDAYYLPDGRVQPATTIWDTRALVRRGAILATELGKKNRNMVHMTNTAIAPIISFASSQLGWEYRSGDSDF